MADINFVCVRADVEHAEALADMFETVGLSTDGAPADGEASSACIILWSEASVRSRPFLDAAERQIGAGNALVACLSEAPPVGEIDGAPVFDLSAWNGDPNDEAVDALFFEVDRRVMKAHARKSAEPAPRIVALHQDDGAPPKDEIAPAETDYFAQYGADAFADLLAGASYASAEARIEIAPAAPPRPPRTYRGARARASIMHHGGAAARLMALVLLVGGGVAFAATSLAPQQEQPVRHVVHETAPLSTIVATDAPMPEFIAEPDAYAEAFANAPTHAREPASAPASALRDLNAAYEPAAETVLGDTPAPLPFWLEAELSAAPLIGAPLVMSPTQDDAMLGSAELPDELFKHEKAPSAV